MLRYVFKPNNNKYFEGIKMNKDNRDLIAKKQTSNQIKSFKKYDIKYCHWIASKDCCELCNEIATKNNKYGPGIYKINKLPNLPVHKDCRCSISAFEPYN